MGLRSLHETSLCIYWFGQDITLSYSLLTEQKPCHSDVRFQYLVHFTISCDIQKAVFQLQKSLERAFPIPAKLSICMQLVTYFSYVLAQLTV